MEKLGIQQDVEAKERKELLHADTQRLFRESKDAAFKPIPVVHTPISSVLEKIRKRKLEVSKKTMMLSNNSSIHKISASREIMMEVEAKSTYSEEQRVDKLEIELKGKADFPSIDTGRTTDTSNTDEISVSPITRSSEIAPDEMVASIKVISNKQTGFSGGYGFVEFNSHTAAEKALQKYSSMTMPDADQPFRLNWASFSTGDKRSNNGSDLSIFVGDLAADVTDTLLHETFSLKYPSVKAAKVVIDANTGRSRGYGFVRFGDDNERSQAMIEMNGVYCSSRPMCIGAATPRKSSGYQQHHSPQGGYSNSALAQGSQPDVDSTNTTIFVGGLDPNVSDEDLRQPFAQYGEIASVKIPVGKGCGFVQFANRNDAEKALQKLNGTAIGKQTVCLSWGRSPANKQELRDVAANIEPKHEKEVNDLINSYKNVYSEWLFALRCGFALLMYGFGSKKALIEDFASRSLTEYSVVIVNGYLQSINLKQVVITLAELLWDQLKLRRKTTSGSLSKSQQPFNTRSIDDLLAFLDKPDLEDEECFVCIVVHNIDGPGVRDSDSQQCLARIAACSHVRVVASIDHVNAPLCKNFLNTFV